MQFSNPFKKKEKSAPPPKASPKAGRKGTFYDDEIDTVSKVSTRRRGVALAPSLGYDCTLESIRARSVLSRPQADWMPNFANNGGEDGVDLATQGVAQRSAARRTSHVWGCGPSPASLQTPATPIRRLGPPRRALHTRRPSRTPSNVPADALPMPSLYLPPESRRRPLRRVHPVPPLLLRLHQRALFLRLRARKLLSHDC